MKNIFLKEVTNEVIERVSRLTPKTQPKWGKMSVGQMLAHCDVAYRYEYEDTFKKPKGLKAYVLKKLIKPMVTSEKPFKQNGPTSPDFKITTPKDFETEKAILINHLIQTQKLGAAHFNNKESHSFGVLTDKEWSNLFYKHIDHHLKQFGV